MEEHAFWYDVQSTHYKTNLLNGAGQAHLLRANYPYFMIYNTDGLIRSFHDNRSKTWFKFYIIHS